MRRSACFLSLVFVLGLSIVGCGSSSSSTAASSPTPADATGGVHARGDIADTAHYLTFHGKGYSLKYVEGWSLQLGAGGGVTINDKDSSETISLKSGSTSAASYASGDLAGLARSAPKYHQISRTSTTIAGAGAIHAQYNTLSPQDPVTGKRVPVLVDRYYIPGAGKLAVLTLETPVGVDNIDAFRLIAHSFRWA